MYNSPYEEYMRNSLGYNMNPMMNMENDNQMYYEDENNFTYNQLNVDNLYPEIYRIIYPMVCKACMDVNENISEDLISRITNEIYINVENAEMMEEKRNAQANSVNSMNNKNIKSDVSSNRTASSNLVNTSSAVNSRQETRQRNPFLRDLIRILVLRELLGRPHRPHWPPFRPPHGGGMGPGPRPPFTF